MTASNSVVLREALILSANYLLAVRSLEATDDEVTSRHILEMLDECVVHGSAAQRADERNGCDGAAEKARLCSSVR